MSSRDPVPPSPPPTNGKPPKRASGSVIPGGWIWLLILAGILILLFVSDQLSSSDQIEHGDFKPRIRKDNVKNVKISTTKITGEFKSSELLADLPEETKKKVVGNKLKFSVLRPTGEDPDLLRDLDKRDVRHGAEKDSTPWLGPVL